jgi:subtilisin family serine protease
MKRRMLLVGLLVALLWATPARADTQFIVRSTLSLQALQTACNPPLLPSICTVVGGLGDPLGQVFLITSPLDLSGLLNLVGNPLGILDAEVDQVLNLVGLANLVPSPISSILMSDRTLVPYPANSATTVWNSYATQPAASIVETQQAQSAFNVTGTGIVVADIDTGVDPNHPALQGVLLQGYDFTRNQVGGSEMTDLSPTFTQPNPCDSTTCPTPVQVNQSSAAILDQSSAAILDTNTQYAAFGHGTMVMGVIHLVAPTAQLLPLKAFKSDGTADLSNILRAIYYGVQNNANVINMSFDTKTASTELKNALDYANQLGLVSVASAGNDGVQETVYPAALQNDVMGVASVGSTTASDGTRSTFSNFGDAIVWVAAPGEEIVTTYPFSTYSAGWGTSFSAPFVSGGVALLRGLQTTINEAQAAAAVAHAAPLSGAGMGNGRLDLVPALQSLTSGPDFAVSATPASNTITAGQTASYTASATPANAFTQTVNWSCSGAPSAATCTVSPSSVTLDGTHAATATVTLTTTARAISPPVLWPRAAPPSYRWLLLAACFTWTVVLLILRHLSSQRWRRGLAAAAGLLAVSMVVYSCGGGYGGPPGSAATTLYSIGLNPTSINGGAASTGTVTLSGAAPSGGAVVSLSSSASGAAVPASVTVAAGATSATFTVTTSSVTVVTPVTISASYGGTTETTLLTVNPATAVALSSVALNPATVNGGSTSMGTVTLSGAAPSGGAVVSLSSSVSGAAVPASVTVAAGATSATFTVTTGSVTVATPVTISASYGGTTKTTLLTVNPATTGGTPAGTYMLTITGTSGTTSHSTTVTVVVN